MEETCRKRGRPRNPNARYHQVLTRMSDKEINRVNEIAYEYDISPSEVLRKAFEYCYNNVF